MNTYVILIDDELYEFADNYEEAKHIFSTIDATCLAKYNGHRKFLMARIDGTNYRIKSGIISQSSKNDLPEDLTEQLRKNGHLQPVRLDENTVMYVRPNPRRSTYNPFATGTCRRFDNLADVMVGDVILCLSERA